MSPVPQKPRTARHEMGLVQFWLTPNKLFGQVQKKKHEKTLNCESIFAQQYDKIIQNHTKTPKIRLHPSHPGQQIYRSKLAQCGCPSTLSTWIPILKMLVHFFPWDPHPSMDIYQKLNTTTHQQNMESVHHESDGNAKVKRTDFRTKKIHSCRLQAFVYGSKPQLSLVNIWASNKRVNGCLSLIIQKKGHVLLKVLTCIDPSIPSRAII